MTKYDLAVERLKEAEQRLRLAKWQFQQGQILKTELRMAEMEVKRARMELEQALK